MCLVLMRLGGEGRCGEGSRHAVLGAPEWGESGSPPWPLRPLWCDHPALPQAYLLRLSGWTQGPSISCSHKDNMLDIFLVYSRGLKD